MIVILIKKYSQHVHYMTNLLVKTTICIVKTDYIHSQNDERHCHLEDSQNDHVTLSN